MRIRVAVPAFVVSIALLAGPGLAAAAPGEVVDGGVDLVAEGKVVAKDEDSLVVRTDDHGHKIEFVVDRSTSVPDDVAVGRHVQIVYHATGTHGQTADKVTVTPARKASR
jgi:hypothetical protein